MKRLLNIITTPAARSAAIFYFGNFASSLGRYFFHLLLLRLLLPNEYGEFLAYLSLLYLLNIPNGTIANIVTKHVAEFNGKGNNRAINLFFYYMVKRLAPISFILGTSLIIFAPQLASVFKAHAVAFIVLGCMVYLGLFATTARSFLSGFQRFKDQVLVDWFEVASTIIVAYFLIRLGLSATGAVTGLLATGFVGTSIVLWLIRSAIYPKDRGKTIHFSIRDYSGFSLIYATGSLSLISSDVLLVRYLFDEYSSGIYSALSILGRMIFFGLGPLISLVLPVAAHRHAAVKQSRSVLLKLGAVILVFGLGAAGLFSLFPGLVVRLLSGPMYLSAAVYLPIFSFSMLFFALNLFIVSYLMAIGKPKANLNLLLAALAQPLLILLFHKDLGQIVWLNLALETVLLTSLLFHLRSEAAQA